MIFENETGFKVWGNFAMFAPANHNMSYHDNTGHSKEIYTSSQAWLWATVNNAADIFRLELCPENGIDKPPSDIRIWTLRMSGDWAGSAPMARHITLSIDNLMDFLAIGVASIKSQGITTALSICMPDVFILKDYTDTRYCHATVWHELSHASHYSQVGKSYWSKYITAIIANRGYGDDGKGLLDGYIGVGEMWGNYFGNYFCSVDRFKRSTNWEYDEDYYNPGFLRDVDAISDVETYEIFNCLTSTTNTIEKLKTKLKTITSYDTQVENAYKKSAYSDWP